MNKEIEFTPYYLEDYRCEFCDKTMTPENHHFSDICGECNQS